LALSGGGRRRILQSLQLRLSRLQPLAQGRGEQALAPVEALLSRFPAAIRAHVVALPERAAREPPRAREAMRQVIESDLITIRPAEAGRGVIACFGLAPVQLMTGTSSESVVAGAPFGTLRRSVEIL